MDRVLRSLLAAGLLLLMLASPADAAAPADARDGVLVLTEMPPRNVQRIVERLRSGAGSRKVDVQVPRDAEPRDAFVRRMAPSLSRYQVVYATSTALAREVQRVDATTPIVFYAQSDPVTRCVVDSLARPGRNATGYVDYLPDDDVKQLQLLVEGYQNLRVVYFLVSGGNYFVHECGVHPAPASRVPPRCVAGPRDAASPDLWWMQETAALGAEARRLRVELRFLVLCSAADFEALESLERGRPDVGIVVPYQNLFVGGMDELLRRVARSARPAIYARQTFAARGGLLAVAPLADPDADRAPLELIGQVLAGRSPATIPVQTPRGFRISVNARTAAQQGLVPSLALLRRADEIIERSAP